MTLSNIVANMETYEIENKSDSHPADFSDKPNHPLEEHVSHPLIIAGQTQTSNEAGANTTDPCDGESESHASLSEVSTKKKSEPTPVSRK